MSSRSGPAGNCTAMAVPTANRRETLPPARTASLLGHTRSAATGWDSPAAIIRMIAARWFGLPPAMGRIFFCDPASVGVLGFEHNSLEEPVIRLWNYITLPRE